MNEFNICISNTCIAKDFSTQTWTVKKIPTEPAGVNADVDEHIRYNFVTYIMTTMANGKTVMYHDETNLNLLTQRTCGRAPAGKRAKRTLPNSKGPNVHCIGLYAQLGGMKSTSKDVDHSTKQVSVNGLYYEYILRT